MLRQSDGLGPLIWAPVSELDFVGRSPVYAVTFVAFLCFSVLVATAKSWRAFLAFRFFQAFFGSPCLANGGASMHDLFPEFTVPYSLTVWISAAYCGPALGPLLAGYVVPEKGWRFGMWEIVYMAGPVCFLILFLPETHEPTIQRRCVGTKVPKQEQRDLPRSDCDQRNRFNLIVSAISDAIVKPIQICVLDPAIAVANLYTSFIYGTYYTLFDALPRVYPINYGFDAGELGLAFLSVFAACIVGGLVYSLYVYKVLNPALRQGGMPAHEDRLRPALVACFLPPIGLFLFGWTSEGDIHWLVSITGIAIYAMGTFIILQCISVYLTRIYPEYSASLFASNDFCRSSLATAAIHFGVPLYGNLGVARGVSILGGLSTFGVAGVWFIYWKGASLRAQSRFVTVRVP
jgi:DHA1 family multidrug resistance protein-like MFS transporter